jgi:hypothetical protein
MLNKGDQLTLEGGIATQISREEFGIESIHQDLLDSRPGMYLRYWGTDYPYLLDSRNSAEGCLPIPENSEAQRFIRIRHCFKGLNPVF